jgi:hypothetical protein
MQNFVITFIIVQHSLNHGHYALSFLHNFRFSKIEANYAKSNKTCVDRGAHLFFPTFDDWTVSESEIWPVAKRAKEYSINSFWIGLTGAPAGHFKYYDGAMASIFTTTDDLSLKRFACQFD